MSAASKRDERIRRGPQPSSTTRRAVTSSEFPPFSGWFPAETHARPAASVTPTARNQPDLAPPIARAGSNEQNKKKTLVRDGASGHATPRTGGSEPAHTTNHPPAREAEARAERATPDPSHRKRKARDRGQKASSSRPSLALTPHHGTSEARDGPPAPALPSPPRPPAAIRGGSCRPAAERRGRQLDMRGCCSLRVEFRLTATRIASRSLHARARPIFRIPLQSRRSFTATTIR